MKKVIFATLLALASISAIADQHVNGYTRSNGTYVQPYQRTTPDGNAYNNYSTQGNTNPYTGQAGTVNPYQQQIQPVQPAYPVQQYRNPYTR